MKGTRGVLTMARWWKGVGAVPAILALAGCASTQVEPYRLSVKGMADTGDQVRPLIKSPLTPGEQALVDAWDFQRKVGHTLADGER